MTVTDRSGDAATSPLAASVGLTDDDLVAMYRTVALARAVDERMWILNRAGRIPFVISGQGHEGAQVGLTWPLQKRHDWIAPFYRSIATCLAFGMSARDIMTAQYATASDPSSGGRQMPGHYGYAEHHLVSVSSPVATQILHAVGIALAAKIRQDRPGRDRDMGEGSSNQGDVHEALNFAAIHKLPFVFMVENNGYAISRPGGEGAERQGRGGPRVRVRDARRRRRRHGRPRLLRGGQGGGRPRARSGGGPSLIEAKVTRLTAHSSDDQQTKYRSADDLEEGKAHDPLPIFRTTLRDGGVLTDEIEAALTAEITGIVDDATDYAEGAARPRSRDRARLGLRRALAGRDAAAVARRGRRRRRTRRH